jgi:hypothetical protein
MLEEITQGESQPASLARLLAAGRWPDVIGVSPDVVEAFGVHGIVWLTEG